MAVDWKKFLNPLVIWTPGGQLKHEIIDRAGSQLDLLPTIMGILGGDYIQSSWGKDLLVKENNKNNFAYVVENNFVGIIDEENIYIDGITVDGVLRKKSDDSIKAVDSGAGVLLIIKNYSGDVMNFEMAAEMAEMEGINVKNYWKYKKKWKK